MHLFLDLSFLSTTVLSLFLVLFLFFSFLFVAITRQALDLYLHIQIPPFLGRLIWC